MKQNYESDANWCSSGEISRPPNDRRIHISTSNNRSVFSYARSGGQTKGVVFVEADNELTSFEQDFIRFMYEFWNNRRNKAMEEWIEKNNNGVEDPTQRRFCLRQDTNLLQAAQGDTRTMLFAIHSDRGPELVHISLDKNDPIWRYMNHVSSMEVFTFSAVHDKVSGRLASGDKGKCRLDIYTHEDKPQASIPIRGGTAHAQLPRAQGVTQHNPEIDCDHLEDTDISEGFSGLGI